MRATAQEPGPAPDVADVRLSAAAARLQALTRADGAAIALQAEDVIRCRASVGNAPEVGAPVRLDSGLSAICIRTAAAICCADTEHDERVDAASCRELNLRSAVVAPVMADGSAVGLVACFWSRPRAFDRETVAAVQFLAEALSARGQAVPGAMPGAVGGSRHIGMRGTVAICFVVLVAVAALYGWRYSHKPQGTPRAAPSVAGASAPTVPLGTLAVPVLVSRVEPEYPRSALMRATEREIVLDLTVDRDGRVDRVKIAKGDPVLAIAAAGTVARWRYRATENPDPAFRMSTRVTLQLP